jgi:hypothetical protein
MRVHKTNEVITSTMKEALDRTILVISLSTSSSFSGLVAILEGKYVEERD